MTLTKFAKLAHVSISTASKAFSMSDDISEQTREELFSLARECGCFKKFFNAKCPHLSIGLLIPEFTSYIYADCVGKLQNALKALDCELCVSATDFSAEREQELIEYFCKYSAVDGLILISPKSVPAVLDLPAVILSGKSGFSGEEAPLCRALEYLSEKGVRSVGFLGESRSVTRLRLFKNAMQKVFGTADESLIEISPLRFEQGGYAAMEAYFRRRTVPRAVFCAYDYMAIGAMRCIREHSLRIPEDIAVIGFDNISVDPFLDPPLASISENRGAICSLAAEAIVRRVLGEPDIQECPPPAELYLRRSFEV